MATQPHRAPHGRRRILWIAGAVLAALLAAAVAWYLLSPGLTVKAMVDAAEANDEARFSSYVDYQALRTDMKTELTQRLQEEAKRDGSPEAKLGLAMGMAMMGPIVDSMVSPSGMKTAFANLAKQRGGDEGKADGDGKAKGATGDKAAAPKMEPQIRRQGLNRFIVTGKDTPESGLVFERRGLSWKLAGIDLAAVAPTPPSR